MLDSTPAKAKLGTMLKDLKMGAGNPTYETIIKDVSALGTKLNKSSLGDWFAGHAVPADKHSLGILVTYLAKGDLFRADFGRSTKKRNGKGPHEEALGRHPGQLRSPRRILHLAPVSYDCTGCRESTRCTTPMFRD
ncbi:hypothetical protein [Rhodococcus sp. NPDC060176]|uniref:hypothetical protein n=1 Tax=Rhodococcus sp. NPDC060176 TaxID=3347062 RepID=UPI003652364B